ncbi:hypothetical protein JP74_23040 [Devosia sp. 17-2-E-8]|nr:hypothetical protein JP74_23040 [Devosia sp. 17-2-E-8]
MLEGLRAEIVGRRIDEVAGEEGSLGKALDLGSIGPFGKRERERIAMLTVAIEAVGAEAEAERGEGRIAELAGKTVIARLECAGGEAGDQFGPIGLRAKAEGVAGEFALPARQRQQPAALAGKAIGPGPGGMRGRKAGGVEFAFGNAGDGLGLGPGHDAPARKSDALGLRRGPRSGNSGGASLTAR